MASSKKTAAGCGTIRKKVIRRGGKEYEYYVAIGILLSMVSRTGMYRFDLKLLLVSFICELAIIMVTSSRFTTQNLYQIVKGAE